MKKLLTLLLLSLTIQNAIAKSIDIDSVYKTFSSEKDESKRLKALNAFFGGKETKDPKDDMRYAQRVMLLARKDKDKISEAIALSQIGMDYMAFGNTVKGLEYRLKSIEVAETTNNFEMIGDSQLHLGLHFFRQGDYNRAIAMARSGYEAAIKANNEIMQTWSNWLLGVSYCELGKPDTALMYAQRSYDISIRINYKDVLDWNYSSLGLIQAKLGNDKLALGYFEMAIKEATRKNTIEDLNKYYTQVAQFYADRKQEDSTKVYAKKAIATVRNTPYQTSALKPAKLLLDLYRTQNSDSAFKYSEIYRVANDSLYSAAKVKQENLMTITEDLRQQELADQKELAKEDRKHNIQLSLLAIGIVTFIILFLLLSRSFITNTRIIEFFGVIALLLVFEFLNLLMHPLLEGITHHSPVLMLLALVCIAAVLVPLHHKVEKWSTHKLVEKNKTLRLAHAKKTIEALEGELRDDVEGNANP